MANIYEINQAILDCIDPETGEVLDMEALEQLQMDRVQKAELKTLIECQEVLL